MRANNPIVLERQAAKAAERTAAVNERLTKLVMVAGYANHADLKFLAIHCGTNPTFATILRVLEARNV